MRDSNGIQLKEGDIVTCILEVTAANAKVVNKDNKLMLEFDRDPYVETNFDNTVYYKIEDFYDVYFNK